ncbi:MAG: hypothetical protein WCA13_12730 [Terriglobales bacterium]|jgi:hypothetical protein
MKKNLPAIYWVEAFLAAFAALAAAVTALTPDWIERILSLDPDNYSGSLEWKLVVALFLAAALLSALALRNRRTAPHAG